MDDSHEHTRALRRLGFREGAMVEMLSGHDPVLVRCENSCLAIGRCMLTGVSIIRGSRAQVCSECPTEPQEGGLRPSVEPLARRGLVVRLFGQRD